MRDHHLAVTSALVVTTQVSSRRIKSNWCTLYQAQLLQVTHTHVSYPQQLANLQVGHMVFQQSLGITDVFFGSYKDEGNHTLKEENTNDLNEKLQCFIEANKHSICMLVYYCVILCSLSRSSRVWGVLKLTSSLGSFLSLSPSIRTRTTPDLSTISWMILPLFPITLPRRQKKRKL